MRAPIGFVLLTYLEPGQIHRLVTRLRDLYGPGTPIAINHKLDQCPLDTEQFPPDIRWVRPHITTGWGVWPTVEATLEGLRLLHAAEEGPDFSVLLSGTDYPIARPERVLGELRSVGADAYIDARPVEPWRRSRTSGGPLGIRVRVRSPLLAPLLSPFSPRYRCWAGEHWWTLGRRAVEHLLRQHQERPDVVRWFAARHVPEEAYVHTVTCNAPGLRVEHRAFRYVDWTSRAPSPRTLGEADLPRLLSSGAHFARKFAPDAPVLDAVDRALGLPPWRGGRASMPAAARSAAALAATIRS